MDNPQFIEKFANKIDHLGYYSEKNSINELTEYAETYIGELYCQKGDKAKQGAHAKALTSAIESKIMLCSPKRLLPIFHMMDSILKNVGLKPQGRIYISALQNNIQRTYCSAYDRIPVELRPKLVKLLGTWTTWKIFSEEDRRLMSEYPQRLNEGKPFASSAGPKPGPKKTEPISVRVASSRPIRNVENGSARNTSQPGPRGIPNQRGNPRRQELANSVINRLEGKGKGPPSSYSQPPPHGAQDALASLAAFSRQQQVRSLTNPSKRERDILADLFSGISDSPPKSWEEMMGMDQELLYKIKDQAVQAERAHQDAQAERTRKMFRPGHERYHLADHRSRSKSPPLGAGGGGQSIADMIASKIGPGLPKVKQPPPQDTKTTTTSIANMLAQNYQGPIRRQPNKTPNPALKPSEHTSQFEKTFSITHGPGYGPGQGPPPRAHGKTPSMSGHPSWMGSSAGHDPDAELKQKVSSEFQKGKVLNKTIPSVIRRLYDDEMTFQCPETGVRFQTEQEYTEYLDAQARSKRMKKDNKGGFRHWFPSVQDWATNFANAQNVDDMENLDLFGGDNKDSQHEDGGETEEVRAAADAARVSCRLGPGVTKCVMCEEKFDTLFDDDSGEWMFRDAHSIDIEGKLYILKTSCFRNVTAAIKAKGGDLKDGDMMKLIGASDPSTPRGKRHLEDEMKRQLHTLQETGDKSTPGHSESEDMPVKLEYDGAVVAGDPQSIEPGTLPPNVVKSEPSGSPIEESGGVEVKQESSDVPSESLEIHMENIAGGEGGIVSGDTTAAGTEVGSKRHSPSASLEGADDTPMETEDATSALEPAGKKKRARFK